VILRLYELSYISTKQDFGTSPDSSYIYEFRFKIAVNKVHEIICGPP
jgi:hypothetical protein